MDSIIMNGYFNDSHWRRFAADRKAKHDIRMKVDIGNFHYATHMATCIQGGSPTVLMTLRKQHSDNNYIGVLHVQTDDTQDNNRQLKVSSPANMEITLDGTGICAYAGIVPSAETGSKIARCAFDNKGQLVHMETVRLRSTVKSMAVGPSFGEVVIGSENSVMLFNYERKKGVQFIPSKPPVLAVTCKANGNEIFAGAGKYGINVFDIREYGGRPTYFLPGSFCCSMQLLGNGRSIITSHFGGDLLAYDLRMRKAVDAYRGHVNPVYWMLPLLLDDRKETVASAGSDGVIRTWSVRTAELLMSFNPPYTVLNPWHVPRFVYSDTWCGTAKNPTLLATWLNTLELSQMRRPMEMCLLGNMEDTDISTTKMPIFGEKTVAWKDSAAS
uniref:Uncharacterized protein n=1 Tax=Trichuris muris TaxID=70415 RepID=A0A5S6QFS8_TRIMR